MEQRTFPAPWRVDTTAGGHFTVKDANGFPLVYVYCRTDTALRGDCLTPAEALQVAEAIAKLPELLRR